MAQPADAETGTAGAEAADANRATRPAGPRPLAAARLLHRGDLGEVVHLLLDIRVVARENPLALRRQRAPMLECRRVEILRRDDIAGTAAPQAKLDVVGDQLHRIV